MIAQERIDEVKRLFATGLYSQRQISRMTGVSRIVIHRVVHGKRKDRVTPPSDVWDVDWRGRPAERCPVCGIKVQMPCLACFLRQTIQNEKTTLPDRDFAQISDRDAEENAFKLELDERHHHRYEQVKAWREASRDPNFTEIPENWPFRKRPPGSKQQKRNNEG